MANLRHSGQAQREPESRLDSLSRERRSERHHRNSNHPAISDSLLGDLLTALSVSCTPVRILSNTPLMASTPRPLVASQRALHLQLDATPTSLPSEGQIGPRCRRFVSFPRPSIFYPQAWQRRQEGLLPCWLLL